MAQAPIAVGETSQHVAFRANESLVAELQDFLERSGRSKADVLRAAVREYLDREVAAS